MAKKTKRAKGRKAGKEDKKNPIDQVGTSLPQEAVRFLQELSKVDLKRLSYLMQDRKTQILYLFLSGIARGIGSAVGFAFLLVLSFILLRQLASKNLPLIGDFLAELVKFVQRRM